jgi:hypothetical protein
VGDPLPEVARVRGGGSARIGAVIVSVVLVAVVVVGLSGQPQPSAVSIPPATAPAIADAQSSARGLSNERPEPAATIAPAARPTPTPLAADTYGLALVIGNVRYVTIMSELSPGVLTADLNFPSPPRLPEGSLEFSELWKQGHLDAAALIDRWPIDLAAVAQATRTPARVLIDTSPPQPRLEDVPPAVSRGFAITVEGINDLLFNQLNVEITLGAQPGAQPPTQIRQLGVTVNLPTDPRAILEPGTNGTLRASLALPRPRRPVNVSLLLYDVQQTQYSTLWKVIAEVPFRLTPRHADIGRNRLVIETDQAAVRVMARTSGTIDGESIILTVICRPTQVT